VPERLAAPLRAERSHPKVAVPQEKRDRKMQSPFESLEIIQRTEDEPTPLWHLAKCASVSEKSLYAHLYRREFTILFRDGLAYISKVDARKLMGIEGEL
jgi:hypothetical protein